MSATELEEVQALLERVLPDPAGFAERLCLQIMTRWGNLPEPGARAFYTATTVDDAPAGEPVMTADPVAADEAPVDTNILLAAALGACQCWGLRAGCRLCGGYGSAGWAEPDPELFEELVGPAIARLTGFYGDGSDEPSRARADHGSSNDHTTQGEKP
ncbi:MAG: hypothetical protein QOJ73_3286 [Streptosporangiaceae bacterium]|jgi:hypothetical protein|nr:hypothetical protein [Streptosporangiaceae bacterium]